MSEQKEQFPDFVSIQEKQSEHAGLPSKKKFVDPQVLAPLDVLEATTSFLFVTADTSVIS